MNKLKLIILREYLSRVRKKSFILMTLITPLLIAGIFILPSALTHHNIENLNIVVVNDANLISELPNTENITFTFLKQKKIVDKQDLLDSFDGILSIPNNSKNQFLLFSKKQISLTTKQNIKNIVEEKITQKKWIENGINLDVLEKSKAKIELNTKIIKSDGQESSSNSELSLIIALLSGFLIYFFIFMYGSMVMRGVIEEKVNRIIEVMISSVKTFELMIGKIVGIAMVGITQFTIWFLLFSLASFIFPILFDSQEMINSNLDQAENLDTNFLFQLDNFPILSLISGFLFYFIGGYLLYGSLFAAVGAAVDQETDSQQFVFPLTLPLILSIILIQPIVENPHGNMAYWFSMFPFTSPIVMMVRIPFGVPIFELVLSTLILTISFISTIWLASKIYRVGILMYGKKASFKELWKWINYKK